MENYQNTAEILYFLMKIVYMLTFLVYNNLK